MAPLAKYCQSREHPGRHAQALGSMSGLPHNTVAEFQEQAFSENQAEAAFFLTFPQKSRSVTSTVLTSSPKFKAKEQILFKGRCFKASLEDDERWKILLWILENAVWVIFLFM